MKRIIFTIVIVLFSIVAYSQGCNSMYGEVIWRDSKAKLYQERAEKVKNSTLYVGVDKETDLGKEIMKAFYKYWTFSKFEIVDINELGKYVSDENNSFFSFIESEIIQGCFEWGYGIRLGGKKVQSVNEGDMAEYVQVKGIVTGITLIADSTMKFSKDAKDAEKIQTISMPLTACFILRLQQSLNDAINNVKYPVTEKIKVDTNDCKIRICFINTTLSEVRKKNIYMYDLITDDTSKKMLAIALNMPEDSIFIVDASALNKQLEKKNENDLFIYDVIGNDPVAYTASGGVDFLFLADRIIYKYAYNRRVKK